MEGREEKRVEKRREMKGMKGKGGKGWEKMSKGGIREINKRTERELDGGERKGGKKKKDKKRLRR